MRFASPEEPGITSPAPSGKSGLHPAARPLRLRVPETAGLMIVDHADSLHERVANRWPDKREPPLLQVPAHGLRLWRSRGNVAHRPDPVIDRLAAGKLPDVGIEGSEFFLNVKKFPGIPDSGGNFQPVSDDPGIGEEARDVRTGKTGDGFRVKIMESLPVILPFVEHGLPGKPGLHPFQDQELEKDPVVMDGEAPFFVMVPDHQVIGAGAEP